MVINSITIKSNDTSHGELFEEFIAAPDTTPLNLPLYNDGGPSTVEIHVKEEDAALAQFWNIQVDVTDAEKVTLILKNKDGTNVTVIEVILTKNRVD